MDLELMYTFIIKMFEFNAALKPKTSIILVGIILDFKVNFGFEISFCSVSAATNVMVS